MKLGAKIGTGFMALLAIAASLGILAIWNMNAVMEKSVMLDEEYVPEVGIANQVERKSLETMYAMRGYGFTEEEKFLLAGRDSLTEVKKALGEAKALAAKSPHLVKLIGAVDELEAGVREYEGLTAQTVAVNAKMAEDRKALDTAAQTYMKNCNDYLAGQNQKMAREIEAGAKGAKLKERLEKITLVNDIIDLGNATRLAAWTLPGAARAENYPRSQRQFRGDEEEVRRAAPHHLSRRGSEAHRRDGSGRRGVQKSDEWLPR